MRRGYRRTVWDEPQVLNAQMLNISHSSVSGGWSKRWVWEGSRKLGVQVLLVEEFDTHFARDLADVFISFPGLSDHTRDEEHARRIVGALKVRRARKLQ